MKYTRDATDSFKGYEFQFYYFLKLLLKEHENIKYIIFEGCEDIDIMYKNNKYKIIQVKYHGGENPSEGCGENSGLTKVVDAYENDYKGTKNKNQINEIIYFINNENYLFSKEMLKMTEGDIEFNKKIMLKKYPDKQHINEFTEKLTIINKNNSNITNLIDEILTIINSNDFYNFGSNAEFKKEIVFSKLVKYTLDHFCTSKEKELYPEKIFNSIKTNISSDYTINKLVDEIINGLECDNSVIKIQCETILTNDFLLKLNFEVLYRILNVCKKNTEKNQIIKITIINKIFEKINKSNNNHNINHNINHNNYCNFQYVIGHLHNLVYKNSTANGVHIIDVLNNFNTLDYCNKYKVTTNKNNATHNTAILQTTESTNDNKTKSKVHNKLNLTGTVAKPKNKQALMYNVPSSSVSQAESEQKFREIEIKGKMYILEGTKVYVKTKKGTKGEQYGTYANGKVKKLPAPKEIEV